MPQWQLQFFAAYVFFTCTPIQGHSYDFFLEGVAPTFAEKMGVVPMIEEYLLIREDFMECSKLTSSLLRCSTQFFFLCSKNTKN